METAIISSTSKSDFKLLMQIAKKLDIDIKKLSEEDIEDLGLGYAIKSGKTGEFVDPQLILKALEN